VNARVISRRIPHNFEPNEISRAPRPARLLDLTVTNPTMVGLPAPPEAAWRGLIEGARAPYTPEPFGLATAREAVAAYYGGRVPAANIALTASTSEAYAHLFRLLADPGDVVAAPEPSYPLFAPLAALEGIEIAPYPLRYRDGRWRADFNALPDARALIAVQPNNPTGSLFEVREVVAVCARRGLPLIADEVFGDFVARPASFIGSSDCLTFTLGGLSKSCGLPHAKLAWIACSGPGAANALAGLEWICDAFLSVSSPIQHALPALLTSRGPFVEAVRARLAINREALAGLAPLTWEGGWSAVLRAPDTRTDEEWTLALLERGVLVQPGHFFDFADDHHLIVSLLTEPATFAAGARIIAEALLQH
jgi:aspartate/methionine/tyrosine aminotransferase